MALAAASVSAHYARAPLSFGALAGAVVLRALAATGVFQDIAASPLSSAAPAPANVRAGDRERVKECESE